MFYRFKNYNRKVLNKILHECFFNFFFGLIAAGLMLSTADRALAQEEPKPVQSERVQKLQEELAQAKLEAQIAAENETKATSKAAALKAKLPTSTTTGEEGAVETKDADGYYATVLAYKTLEQSAVIIANEIKSVPGVDSKTIIILDDTDLAIAAARWNFIDSAFTNYTGFLESIMEELSAAIDPEGLDNGGSDFTKSDKQESPVVSGASYLLPAIPALLGAVADITNLFKSNVTLKGVATTADETALRAAIARELLALDTKPKPKPKHIFNPNMALASFNAFQEEFIELRNLHTGVKVGLELLKRLVDRKIASLDKKADADEIKQLGNELDGISITTTAALEIIDSFLASLLKADAAGLTPLDKIGVIDVILQKKDDPSLQKKDDPSPTLLLKVDIVSQGGEIQTTTGGIFGSGNVGYMGSTTVVYQLSDMTGFIQRAGVETKACTESTKRKNGFANIGTTKCSITKSDWPAEPATPTEAAEPTEAAKPEPN